MGCRFARQPRSTNWQGSLSGSECAGMFLSTAEGDSNLCISTRGQMHVYLRRYSTVLLMDSPSTPPRRRDQTKRKCSS
ncbi:hypothetical protein JG687_00017466 [Phytophthora cactorum]|uniref:Uncharacterized protein n=1 Tax=Phytophthora cactorum TaxID=29920 RepID=A0A8T1TRG7_9STRA|nr:hypothetical protein JG687_00017466 [Phytophthora cactorum]